LIYIYR